MVCLVPSRLSARGGLWWLGVWYPGRSAGAYSFAGAQHSLLLAVYGRLLLCHFASAVAGAAVPGLSWDWRSLAEYGGVGRGGLASGFASLARGHLGYCGQYGTGFDGVVGAGDRCHAQFLAMDVLGWCGTRDRWRVVSGGGTGITSLADGKTKTGLASGRPATRTLSAPVTLSHRDWHFAGCDSRDWPMPNGLCPGAIRCKRNSERSRLLPRPRFSLPRRPQLVRNQTQNQRRER